MNIWIYGHMDIHINMNIYIYIYIERERERERDMYNNELTNIYIDTFIYICIYMIYIEYNI